MEFNLSEKLKYNEEVHTDVKEFIRLVKAYDQSKLFGNDFIVISKKDFNKLIGDELNGI